MREHIREGGTRKNFSLRRTIAPYCSGTDFDNRVDSLRITLKPKDGFTAEQVSASLTKTNIPNQVLQKNGSLVVNLPPFEWRNWPGWRPRTKSLTIPRCNPAVALLAGLGQKVPADQYQHQRVD